MLHTLPISTLFPYTTLFRSQIGKQDFRVQPGIGEDNRLQLPGKDLFRDSCCFIDIAAPNSEVSVYHRRVVEHEKLFACGRDRKSTRLNSSHTVISYAVFCLK